MESLNTFLAAHAPFDGLDPDQLRELVADAREHTYQAGEAVLIEDGPPADGLWVILSGSMELLHEGEVIEVLEPGQCFGHPSLLSGLAPAFTVRAHERSRCLKLSAPSARRALATEAGARYVATSLRARLVRTGHIVHGLHDVSTTPISAIARPAEFCAAEDTVRDAAARLAQAVGAALLVRLDGGRLGIVTDAEVRAAVAAGLGADCAVRTIARVPAPTVPRSQLAVEAAIDMLAASTEHAVVLDRGRVCGVLSAVDLLGLDARSPIAVRHTILRAAGETELVRAAANLPKLFVLLLRAGVPSRDIGRVLSLQHDAVLMRLIDFALWRHGPAPLAWSWLDLGSAARREFTLASDQDNALAYADPPAAQLGEVDSYFATVAEEVNAGLVRCGIGPDNNGVLAGRPQWRMSKAEWVRTFAACLLNPGESELVRAAVAFDFRQAAGGLALAAELTEYIRGARSHPQFMRLMARTATGYPVAVGRRGQLLTGRDGDPPGRLDLKRRAIVPLVNVVRFYALAHGVTISPTLDRIEALAAIGALPRAQADELADAFEAITRRRFEHHAAQIAAGERLDNLIDPGSLAPIARAELREALLAVRRAQRAVAGWTPTVPPRL